MLDVLAGEAAEVQVGRPDREQHAGRERRDPAEHAAQQPSESATIPVPISAGARRAVKSESPNSTYISAVR